MYFRHVDLISEYELYRRGCESTFKSNTVCRKDPFISNFTPKAHSAIQKQHGCNVIVLLKFKGLSQTSHRIFSELSVTFLSNA